MQVKQRLNKTNYNAWRRDSITIAVRRMLEEEQTFLVNQWVIGKLGDDVEYTRGYIAGLLQFMDLDITEMEGDEDEL